MRRVIVPDNIGTVKLNSKGVRVYFLGCLVKYQYLREKYGWHDKDFDGEYGGCPVYDLPCDLFCGSLFPEWNEKVSFCFSGLRSDVGQMRVVSVGKCPCKMMGMGYVMRKLKYMFPELYSKVDLNEYKNGRPLRRLDCG